MRELEKLTNLTRATINFYIKEGLLPSPQKSAKNMAYYDDAFIQKLQLIEKMKKADFTLNQIKKLINYDSRTVNDYGQQVLESVNRILPARMDEELIRKQQISELGLSDEEISSIMEMNILNSIDQENLLFPSYSITLCRFIKYFMDFGIPLNVIKDILTKLHELIDIEKNAFVNYIRVPMIENSISLEEQAIEVQKCIENINGLLPILHLQFLKLPTENLRKINT